MRHIHTYMHPQWCQLVCLIAIFFVDHWLHQEAEDVRHSCVHAPQWCQRGCLITIFCHGFFLCAWMCSAALVCRRCATFIRTCTHDGVSWCASLRFLFGDHWLHQEAEDVRHSCVHAPPMVSAEVPFSAMDFSCVLGCAPLHYMSMQTMRH